MTAFHVACEGNGMTFPKKMLSVIMRSSGRLVLLISVNCLASALLFQGASAQTKSKRLSPTIPLRFEKQLNERLRLFTQYQADGE
jgi:hypothetical protein